MTTRPERIRERLVLAFQPDSLEIADDSHLHAGHAGARDGRGHFRVYIVSNRFDNMRPLQRHQSVYQALGDMMETDIHALSISAFTPAEIANVPPGH